MLLAAKKLVKMLYLYSQFLRLCSQDNDFVLKVNEMENFFLVRDYPQKVIDKAKASVIGSQIKLFKKDKKV